MHLKRKTGSGIITRLRLLALVCIVTLNVQSLPASAARPLLDSGKWDSYFALFARDTQVPWKKISVRLDTYSGAAVDFAAYLVDPADVLVAGANAHQRAIDTSHRSPVVRWRFSPPPGYTFESSDVEVPLRGRQGFFVIEARRGQATQQVWLNLSRIGLLTKESAGGIVLYGADLGSGRALRGMRLTYLIGSTFGYAKTDDHGIARVSGQRPRFVLAEWGESRAFVDLVPVSPTAAAVVSVRLDRADVQAGDRLRVVGYVRALRGAELRPATGNVRLTLIEHGRSLVAVAAPLDGTGTFASVVDVPADAVTGEVAVLASAAGATGGATLRVKAVSHVQLSIGTDCNSPCPAHAPIPVRVKVMLVGEPAIDREVRVRVVRTPHVLAPGTPDDAPQWATTTILDQRIRTDAIGVAALTLPAPGDDLASTYGITAQSGNASASARFVTPTARIALAVTPQHAHVHLGEAANVDVRGFDALDGTPAAGTTVLLRLIHGPNIGQTSVRLDASGRARATFRDLILGTSLVTASADIDGERAFDASALAVEPSVTAGGGGGASGEVQIDFDRERYHVNDRVKMSGELAGAVGDAFISLDGNRCFAALTVPVRGGHAAATLGVPAASGDIAASIAFVRNGALYYSTRSLPVDGPGHVLLTTLSADRAQYAPGDTAKVTIDDGDADADATVAVRLSDGRPAQGADFSDAPDALAQAGTTSQDPASDDPAWHAWVAPARSTAGDIFGFDRPRAAELNDASLPAAAPRALLWRVDERAGDQIEVPLPLEAGKYVLSILKMTATGEVGVASIALTVRA